MRSKISFAVRQISLRAPLSVFVRSFILRVSIMDVLDHEGWAVGVAALWGYFISDDVENGSTPLFIITSAEVSKIEVHTQIING